MSCAVCRAPNSLHNVGLRRQWGSGLIAGLLAAAGIEAVLHLVAVAEPRLAK